MGQKQQQLLTGLRVFIDLLMITVSWILAYYIRFYTIFDVPKGIPESEGYFKLVPFIWGVWLVSSLFIGFYKRSRKLRSVILEALDIIQSSGLSILAFIVFTYFYNEYRYSRGTLLIFTGLQVVLLVVGRSFVRKALRLYRAKTDSRRIFMVAGKETIADAFEITKVNDFENAEVFAVLLVDAEAGEETVSFKDLKGNDHHYILTKEVRNWGTFFSENAIESVIFAVPYRYNSFLDENLDEVSKQVGDIRVLPDFRRYSRFGVGVDIVRGMPVINIHESPLVGWGVVLKRAMDIFGALVGIILFSPIMLILSVLIPLTSKGPILYRQERMGVDGRSFYISKFRSMPTNVEDKTGAVWAKKNENRATWIGSFMRKTSLDELPQLFDVLKGHMSLVGPRPERPVFVDEFRYSVPDYMLRHKVKAGITGWAQVNGWRGDTSIEKRIECDLYYIQNWSIWLDIKIILLTFLKGFISNNAY